ncbi:MAG: ABC transporter ATP-binding protein [Proteobacteria bacterium]|nr:ABC transporter ATP-binding protein [Pseudomonadota bacterium]MDA1300772.1 ABC transporter ATP-binding protein [Pseudomonadota bacterium]
MSDNTGTGPAESLDESAELWKARELGSSETPPDISLRRFIWLFRKTWPFMWPMRWHILGANIIFPVVMIAVGTLGGVITGDLWFNKILNGQRLTDAQAFFLFVDDSYLNHHAVSHDALRRGMPPPASQQFSVDIVGAPLSAPDPGLLAGAQADAREKALASLQETLVNTITVEVLGAQREKADAIEELGRATYDILNAATDEEIRWDGQLSDPFVWPWSDVEQRIFFLRANVTVSEQTNVDAIGVEIANAARTAGVSDPEVRVLPRDRIEEMNWQPTDSLVMVNKAGNVHLGELTIRVAGYSNIDQFKGVLARASASLPGIELSGFEMSHAERRTVRNRSIAWFILGSIFGVLVELLFMPYYQSWVWQNVIHYLRVRMIEQVESVSLQFHSDARAGDAIYRVNQDSNQINSALQQVLIGPLLTIYNLLIAVAFVIGFAPLLMWVILAASIPMVMLTWFFTPRLRRRSIANRVANSDLTSRLQETFAANKIVKANRAEQIVLERFRRDSSRALNAALYYRFEMIVLSMLVALVGGLSVIGLEYVMVGWVVSNEQTYLGAAFAWLIGFTLWNLGAFEAARGRVEQVINTKRGIVRWWSMLQDLFIGLERAFYFIDLAPDVTDVEQPEHYPAPIRSVRWSHVNFAYRPAEPVLREVNLEAAVGTMTAIVGQTGSGKSTLMSMLLRLYDPDEGRIEINDVDLRRLRIDDVRSNCAIALQKNVLFTGKIADNISYATLNKTREDVIAAAKVACAHDFIMAMADGYDTELGDRGSKLSSGQRQRLSIARAVIRDTPILILDEPTASLDASTEQQVLRNLAQWGRDKVVFIITHRLSTIRSADQIAVLKDGGIAEVGSHEQLLAEPDGDYSRFIRAETLGAGGQSGE